MKTNEKSFPSVLFECEMHEPTAVHCTSANNREAVAQHQMDADSLALRSLARSFIMNIRVATLLHLEPLTRRKDVRLAEAITVCISKKKKV